MLVCGNCGSHDILETGGSTLVVGCPVCGQAVNADTATALPDGNLAHDACAATAPAAAPEPTPETPVEPEPEVTSEPAGVDPAPADTAAEADSGDTTSA